MRISIVEFSIENYKIFKEKATLSIHTRKNEGHTFESNGENLVRTTLIYGPNASGKTSLLEAFGHMRDCVLLSANNLEATEKLPYFPFKGSHDGKNKPTSFELTFSASEGHDGIYRYCFSFLSDKIVSESLAELTVTGEDRFLFTRDEKAIKLEKGFFAEAEILTTNIKTKKDTLFLSLAAQFNIPFANSFITAFREINYLSGITHSQYKMYTVRNFNLLKEEMLRYIKNTDFCIVDGETREDFANEPFSAQNEKSRLRSYKSTVPLSLYFKHPILDSNNKTVDHFEVPLDLESVGTRKFVAILGPIIDTLKRGRVLIIDELDNSLHPHLTKFIVDLFESEKINKRNAQLIVTTHDTTLLSYKHEFIRDQFWFTDKDENGSAKLFSLSDFDLRNDTDLSRKYLEGRFGAVPLISSVNK